MNSLAQPISLNESMEGLSGNEPGLGNLRTWGAVRPQGSHWKETSQFSTLNVALLGSPWARVDRGQAASS